MEKLIVFARITKIELILRIEPIGWLSPIRYALICSLDIFLVDFFSPGLALNSSWFPWCSLDFCCGDVNGRDSLHNIPWTNWISPVLHYHQHSIKVSVISLYILPPLLNIFFRFSWSIQQIADVENNMSSVERIVHYTTEIEQEAPHEIPDHKPPV